MSTEPLVEGVCVAEYAKSNRSTCKSICGNKIGKGVLRFGVKSKSRFHDGHEITWIHATCGLKRYGTRITRISQFKNWQTINHEDQRRIREHTGELKSEVEEAKDEAEAAKVSHMVDLVEANLSLDEQVAMLEANHIPLDFEIDKKAATIAKYVVADGLLHGLLQDCPTCDNATLQERSGTVTCFGTLSGFLKCPYKTTPDKVERYEWVIPKSLNAHEWLSQWLKENPVAAGSGAAGGSNSSSSSSSSSSASASMVDDDDEENMKTAEEDDGDAEMAEADIEPKKMKVTELREELEKRGLDTKGLKRVLVERLQKALGASSSSSSTKKKSAAAAPKPKPKQKKREPLAFEIRRAKLKRKPERKKEAPKKKKARKAKKARIIPEPGSAVLQLDEHVAAAGGGAKAKIYVEGVDVYNAPMTQVDLKAEINRFYKMQLIQSGSRYGVFTKWGRTGVKDGSYKRASRHMHKDDYRLNWFYSVADAKAEFCANFAKRTGNDWDTRDDFEKIPGKYLHIELSTGNEPTPTGKKAASAGGAKSTLEPRLQSLVELIFDGKLLKESLMEHNVDLENMPLGKLDYDQILEGYEILKEVEQILSDRDRESAAGTADPIIARAKLEEASTRFFTTIPATDPAIIDSLDALKTRMEMMDVLMDLEASNAILEKQDKSDTAHPMDKNYKSLNSDLEALDHKSEEYQTAIEYINNHHNKSEWGFGLKVLDVFRVNRHGEDKKFEPWKENENRQLLWHGSRVTNFMGILGQGLRIAPPEAPMSGYLFGKGVYFANMVSKSSHYCRTSPSSRTGLMLLSEVALGNMYEVTGPTYMDKPRKGHHSTKCMGQTYPNPAGNVTLDNGCVVPLGKKGPRGGQRSGHMGYDELIVYDTTQIKMKYLVKLDFSHSRY